MCHSLIFKVLKWCDKIEIAVRIFLSAKITIITEVLLLLDRFRMGYRLVLLPPYLNELVKRIFQS